MKMKRLCSLILSFSLLISVFSGCGEKSKTVGYETETTITASTGTRDKTDAEKKYGVLYHGEPYTLRVDLNTMMPSEDTENPDAKKAAQAIADEFSAMFPNVTIEWDRTKGDDWAYWMTTQLAANTAPDICFLQGSQYGGRGWFMPLNDELEKPNKFVENNSRWKDQFPDYVWGNYLVSDAADNIVAVPLTIYPGTATAYYYNKEIFDKLNLQVPTEWKDFVEICKKINKAGYVAVASWKDNKSVSTGVWDIQFSLGPTFSYALKDKWDNDKDGNMSQSELLKAAYKGVFDLSDNSGGMAMYDLVKEKYTDVLQTGASATDYESLWNQGKVAMMEDGLWRLPEENANTERNFDYGMFPVPVATSKTSSHAADVTRGEGAFNPPICESYQIVKKTVEAKGEGAKEVCVRFLQWLCFADNLNLLIE